MKIKKINDNKIQIIITNEDLEDRNFKRWELMPLSPKAQELFQDLLEMAYQECGFEIEDDTQLMVEAYPLSVDSFVVVMTKIHSNNSQQQSGFMLNQHEADDDEFSKTVKGKTQIWAFTDLEACIQACARIEPDYVEKSKLFKYDNGYYLIVRIIPDKVNYVEAVLGEYSDWVPLDVSFFQEHGTIMVPRNAVINMASLNR